MGLDAPTVLRGFVAGLAATLAMLPPELVAFSRHGLRGVFEWHEVHASFAGYQSHRPFGLAGYAVHVAVGGVVGAAFAVAAGLASLPVLPSALALGFAFWVGTLLIHERVTAVHPWRDSMGRGPAIATLTSHLLFGAALGLLLLVLT